jgi:hypothetical protein
MDCHATCECGKQLSVTMGQAGSKIGCQCGRTVEVPSLRELRRQESPDGIDANAVLVIRHLLANGELPPPGCSRCSSDHCSTATVVAKCERTPARKLSSKGLVALTFASFIPGLRMYLRMQMAPPPVSEVTLNLPLGLCDQCRAEMNNRSALKETLKQIPIYRHLLESYPSTSVRLKQ